MLKTKNETCRIVVVGLVWNQQERLLFCRMPADRGVFPGEWGFPGGGIEAGESMQQALQRELLEEIGIPISHIEPAFFKDCQHSKRFANGEIRDLYMIFLIFHCQTRSNQLQLNAEFSEYRWISESESHTLLLNEVTRDTLQRMQRWNSWSSS